MFTFTEKQALIVTHSKKQRLLIMYDFTQNEKLAALHLVLGCLESIGGVRPMDLEDDSFTWCHVDVLMGAGWSKHEAAGTYGSLFEKNALWIEKDVRSGDDAWQDTISHELYQWAESHWDEFEANGFPSK
jgi:hypothetical protein